MTNESIQNQTVELIMPQIGEGITHVTVKKWLKQPGQLVKKDDNILEVFSDKVDIMIQATDTGILQKQLVEESKELKIKSPYATLLTQSPGIENNTIVNNTSELKQDEAQINSQNRFYSPLVKSITKEENISQSELEQIKGTGSNGRITKDDIINYVHSTKNIPNKTDKQAAFIEPINQPTIEQIKDASNLIVMDPVRKLIAKNMVKSKQISPHVSSVVEADVTNIVEWKNKHQSKFLSENGIKLTFTPFFTEAVAKALLKYPTVNASVVDDKIILHKNINIGIATVLHNGNLIVPVIKQANEKNIIGLANSINELATKARQNKLNIDDISKGTFTITNMAPFNNIMAFPIIKQPEVAILAIGKITKRVIVTKANTIAIRDMVYLTLTYDHRIIDGALGGSFLSYLASILENFE